MSGINIRIGADVSGAISGLDKLSAANDKTQQSVFNVSKAFEQARERIHSSIDKMASDAINGTSQIKTSFSSLGAGMANAFNVIKQQQNQIFSPGRGLNSFLGNIPASAAQATTALGKLPNITNQSTLALSNLSRVAQDAPYGFLGIANNLNPLLESFQRLKQTTGSTGGALKELGKSLTGAGGIGLAVGVISSLLVVFGDKLFGAGKKAKEASEELKRVNDVLKSVSGTIAERSSVAAASVADEITHVNILSRVILDQTKSYNERNRALSELQRINKNYFGDLTLEQSSLTALTGKVTEYTNALIAAAVVKEFSGDIAKLAVEQAKALNTYNKLSKELDDYRRVLENTKESETSLTGEDRISVKYVRAKKNVETATKALLKHSELVNKISSESLVSRTGLDQAIENSLKFKPLSVGVEIKDLKDETAAIIAKAKKIFDAYKDIITLELDIIPEDSLKVQLEKSKVFLQNYFEHNYKFKIPAPTIEVSPPPTLTDLSSVFKNANHAGAYFASEFGKAMKAYFEGGQTDFTIGPAVIKQLKKENLRNAMQETVADLGTDLIAGIADSLGSGDLKGMFSTFVNTLANGFQAIGKQMIAAAPIISALRAALKTLNPAVLLPAGIALVAIGAALKSTVSRGLPGRATGGPVAGGQPYMVGERGREIFVPSTSGRIIPNNNLGNMAGSAVPIININGNLAVRGNELKLLFSRTDRYQGRNV